MSDHPVAAGAGCLSAVVCVASGSFAGYAYYHEVWPVGFWVAAVVCVLSLIVTCITFFPLGELLLEILGLIFSAFD